MINHKFDDKLLELLAENVMCMQEIRVSELQSLCLARDSEILKLEAKIDEQSSEIKSLKNQLEKPSIKTSMISVQTTDKFIFAEDYDLLKSQNSEMSKKIETLERNLFESQVKCIELNKMIKNCYNEVELITENRDAHSNSIENPGDKQHRYANFIEKEYPSISRSNSQEEDLRIKKNPQKLSLINIINYKSRLGSHSKTPTQKHSVNSFNFPASIQKKIKSPLPKF